MISSLKGIHKGNGSITKGHTIKILGLKLKHVDCRVSNKYFVQTEDLKENVGKHKNTEHDAKTLVSWSA